MKNKVCRTCLSSSGLNPIFPNAENKLYSGAIFITTGVVVAPNDGLPQEICTDCVAFLKKSLQFRDNCRDAEEYLLNLKNNVESLTHKEIGYTKKIKDREHIKLLTLDIEHIESLTPDKNKIIYEPKNKDSKVKDDIESIIKIERVYLEDTTKDDDEDRPLKDWLDDNNVSHRNSPLCFVLEEEINTKPDIQDEESEKLMPKVPPGRISCQYCSKNLSIRSLNKHIAQQHPGVDDTRVKCALCDKYVAMAWMARHRNARHANGDTFVCRYCYTDYESEKLLLAHVPTCTTKKKPRARRDKSMKKLAECSICHKTMLKASLKPHIAVKHEGKGPVCEHCGRRFANNLRLGEHRRARHGHDKFECAQCDYKSASLQTMKNHGRRHRGERPFVCEVCGTGFHSLHLLHRHRQSHRTEKLIKCDLCPATFKANNSLHVHKMTCHSSAAYRCNLCARTFSCKSYATRHIKRVHSLQRPGRVLVRVGSEIESDSDFYSNTKAYCRPSYKEIEEVVEDRQDDTL